MVDAYNTRTPKFPTAPSTADLRHTTAAGKPAYRVAPPPNLSAHQTSTGALYANKQKSFEAPTSSEERSANIKKPPLVLDSMTPSPLEVENGIEAKHSPAKISNSLQKPKEPKTLDTPSETLTSSAPAPASQARPRAPSSTEVPKEAGRSPIDANPVSEPSRTPAGVTTPSKAYKDPRESGTVTELKPSATIKTHTFNGANNKRPGLTNPTEAPKPLEDPGLDNSEQDTRAPSTPDTAQGDLTKADKKTPAERTKGPRAPTSAPKEISRAPESGLAAPDVVGTGASSNLQNAEHKSAKEFRLEGELKLVTPSGQILGTGKFDDVRGRL